MIALVIGATTIIVVIGASAIDSTQNQLRAESAETALTQLDSQTSLVALGSASVQEVNLPSQGSGGYSVDSDAGWMNISYQNSGSTVIIVNTTLGEVTYTDDSTTRIAYQGGGVWRTTGNGGSVMVSPPELHYRGSTLTLPIVSVNNDASIDDKAVITHNNTTKHFPNAVRTNPVEANSVTVEIHSQYHDAWNDYLQKRTEGAVEHYPTEQRVVMTLTVPATVSFEQAVAATSNASNAIDDGSTNTNGGFDSPNETGVSAPLPDYQIENEIKSCENGNCDDLASNLADGTLESGSYYSDSSVSIGETDYQTSSGDIDIVVDGDLTFAGGGGPPGTVHHKILNNDNVTFYVNGSIDISGNTGVNTGGDPSQLLVMVHSEGGNVVAASGTPQFTGLIYAPNSSLNINGGGNPNNDNIVGSVVVKDAEASGNGNLRYDSVIQYRLNFNSASEITYLHTSENSVNITDG